MKKVKFAAIGIAVLLCIAGAIYLYSTYLGNGNWPKRFSSELDRFFGSGNWQVLSEESNLSRMYTRRTTNANGTSQEVPGRYQNWLIGFTDRSGENISYQITNHTLKINHDKYWFLSSKRYSSRQALTLELMDVAMSIAEEELRGETLTSLLTEQGADCLDLHVSYHGGNPPPDFYDKLRQEPWFSADAVTVGDFLSCELYDFYLRISIYDYRFEQLTSQEQQHVLDCFLPLQNLLLEQYGDHASFELYFGEDMDVSYENGVQTES